METPRHLNITIKFYEQNSLSLVSIYPLAKPQFNFPSHRIIVIFQKQVKMNNKSFTKGAHSYNFMSVSVIFSHVFVHKPNEFQKYTHTYENHIQYYNNMSNKASRVDLNVENRHKISKRKVLTLECFNLLLFIYVQ